MNRWILRGLATAGFAAGAWMLTAAPAHADDSIGPRTTAEVRATLGGTELRLGLRTDARTQQRRTADRADASSSTTVRVRVTPHRTSRSVTDRTHRPARVEAAARVSADDRAGHGRITARIAAGRTTPDTSTTRRTDRPSVRAHLSTGAHRPSTGRPGTGRPGPERPGPGRPGPGRPGPGRPAADGAAADRRADGPALGVAAELCVGLLDGRCTAPSNGPAAPPRPGDAGSPGGTASSGAGNDGSGTGTPAGPGGSTVGGPTAAAVVTGAVDTVPVMATACVVVLLGSSATGCAASESAGDPEPGSTPTTGPADTRTTGLLTAELIPGRVTADACVALALDGTATGCAPANGTDTRPGTDGLVVDGCVTLALGGTSATCTPATGTGTGTDPGTGGGSTPGSGSGGADDVDNGAGDGRGTEDGRSGGGLGLSGGLDSSGVPGAGTGDRADEAGPGSGTGATLVALTTPVTGTLTGASGSDTRLPRTGGDLVGLLIGGMVLLLLGVALMVLGRHRRLS